VSPSRDDEDAVSLARLTGRRAYSMIHTTHNGGRAFDIVVPIFTGDRFSGSVTVTIALTAMLADAVPWWIAEQHRISFVNSAGTTLASKSRVETEEAEADYTLAFDPPGHGLYLAIAPYRTKTSLVHNSLVVAIVVLALLSCASLLVAYRHMRGRIRAEEMTRRHSEKLARNARLITMGELASTLAHELNQPLSAIESYATGCLNKLDSGDYTANEMRAALDKLSVQARRAGQVVHHVHEFVSRREPKIGVVDVAALLRDTLAFIAPAARRYDVTLQSEIADDLPNVKADQILLEQVLLNLIRNGFEAMVETPPEDRVLTVSVMRREGGIEIAVADRGCGITPEIAERMFMPFVSTKPEGMGMGLNICRSIIESHRGRLWTTPRPGGGTVFAFTLG
jgi:C4-dicarboxylate-specific signal transduction histidine kinase